MWIGTIRTCNLGGFPAATYTSSGDDVIFDFHGGLQWQWGPWVFGFEVGYSLGWWDMRSTVALPNPPFIGGGPGGLQAYNKISDLITAGVRLGYAWDRLMIYATGGWANAEIHGQYVCGTNGLATFPGVACPARQRNQRQSATSPALPGKTAGSSAPASTG